MRTVLFYSAFLSGFINHFILQAQEIPVDMFTGTPTIEIPLWTVTDHDLSEPISVYYNADGVKLTEQKNICGLGWELEGGGSITREVRGLPDDFQGTSPDVRKGWLYSPLTINIGNFGNTSDTLTSTCTDENTGPSSDYTLLNTNVYTIDTEPDIFRYSAGDISGEIGRAHV